MARGRNYPCPCGSGLKYKRCCELNQHKLTTGRKLLLFIIAIGCVGVAVAAIISALNPEQPPGRVWSPEHGHWHNVSQGSGVNPSGQPIPQPPGPAPPGKAWSSEHGHWHDLR